MNTIPALTRNRVMVSVLLGFLGSVAIWVATPYNNFILRLGFISDSYLPIGAFFVLMLLILGLNPFLFRFVPKWALSSRQLAIVLGMMLLASVLPGQGLLRILPYTLANTTLRVGAEKQLGDLYADTKLPAALFPEKVAYGAQTPASDSLRGELLPGEEIPWSNWGMPLVTWGVFLLFFALMMIGMSLIVLPQWRRNERLAFPLLEVQKSLIEDPPPGKKLAAVFRSRPFWIGAGVVFLLYLLLGANQYFPERIPAIPLSWDLRSCFTEEPWRYLPGHLYRSRVYFLFVAVAFFMPTRIGFSIWFMTIAYGAYRVIGYAYVPPFHQSTIYDHRMGTMIVLTGVILWLGRARWGEIARAIGSRPRGELQSRDRNAGFLFLTGGIGMYAWFVWAGSDPVWALLFVVISFMVCLLITRLVSETGVPFMRIYDCQAEGIMGMLPLPYPGSATVFLAGITSVFAQLGSRVNGMTMATHALALDDRTPPKKQARVGLLLVAVLVVGLAISGAAHLYFSYHHSMSIDGEASPVSPWGYSALNGANRLMLNWERDQVPKRQYNRPAHITFGVVLAGALQWACMAMPTWPLHPVGILMVYTFYGNQAWASIFLGWLLKVLLVRYGGSRLYRTAKPFFLGLIVGEVFAVTFWSAVPGLLVFLGKPYMPFYIQPL